jgi:hypothetical protein
MSILSGRAKISVHSRVSGNPVLSFTAGLQHWIPAFAGTSGEMLSSLA